MNIECPRHEGAFDCNPFCNICEGEQEYDPNETLPCVGEDCEIQIPIPVYIEELGMCVDCSNKYYDSSIDL